MRRRRSLDEAEEELGGAGRRKGVVLNRSLVMTSRHSPAQIIFQDNYDNNNKQCGLSLDLNSF